MSKESIKQAIDEFRAQSKGRVVLLLQGGGALDAYQVGVYRALHEAGVELDRIIGTSIGAINAAIIAGNRFAERLAKLDEFGEECNAQALAVCIGRAGPRRTVETHATFAWTLQQVGARGRLSPVGPERIAQNP